MGGPTWTTPQASATTNRQTIPRMHVNSRGSTERDARQQCQREDCVFFTAPDNCFGQRALPRRRAYGPWRHDPWRTAVHPAYIN